MKELLTSIHEKLKQEKLVIFVGAGVSKNSNVPTWGQIVRTYSQKLHYSKDILSTDDYLKIPQYYYSYDKSNNHQNYYAILQDAFSQDFQSNILNDLIISFHAQHIITTNYDHLLDHYNYEVIKDDRDLLKASSSHYLIKMHGDIDNIQQIIFKEDDYLSYSQTHVLIELFIKSLLIDHTFLFVGYSLNDYNLKTFLNWIDYLSRQNNVKDHMHCHYLITTDILPSQDYLYSYYQDKNIQVINLNLMDDELLEEAHKVDLEDEIGQKTYICLKHIKEC